MAKQTKKLISGALILSMSGLIVKLISILYKMPLTNLIGVESMGYFNTVYSTYLLLTTASLTGIPMTISKRIAEGREDGGAEKAGLVFRAGLFLSLGIGGAVTLFFCLLPSFSSLLSWEPELRYVIWGLAFAPLLISVTGSIRGYFQGMEDMVPTAVSQIFGNLVRVSLGVGFVYLLMRMGYPDYISIAGATIGISLEFVVTSIYLIRKYRKYPDRQRFSYSAASVLSEMKKIAGIGVPVTLAVASLSIMGVLDSLLIYRGYAKIGETLESARIVLSNVTTIQTVINIPLAISVALTVSLLPSLAISKIRQNREEIKDKINASLQLATKMAFPAMAGISVLADPLLRILYSDSLDAGLLRLYSVCMIFMILAQTLSSMLQGLSHYSESLISLAAGILAKSASMYYFLNRSYGGYALIWSSLFYFIVIFACNYYFLKREFGMDPSLSMTVFKPFAASAVMGGIVWIIYQTMIRFQFSLIGQVFPAVGLGGVIYMLQMFWYRAFTEEELAIMERIPGIHQIFGR